MSPETLIRIVEIIATILWCHAALLALEWLGTLRRASQNDKVGHVVSLLGAFVPVVVTYITVVLVGAVIGLPSMVVFLALIVPGGLVFGLRMELSDETQPTWAREQHRFIFTIVLVCLVIGYQQYRG